MERTEDQKRRESVALFRHALIGDLVQSIKVCMLGCARRRRGTTILHIVKLLELALAHVERPSSPG
jgi:hypothetical protein